MKQRFQGKKVSGTFFNTCKQRQLAVAVGDEGEQAIRTPAWMLRQPSTELFTKPDDRWESNDVADLCPEVVEQLREELADFEQCSRQARPLPLSPQDDELVVPSR